MNLHITIHDVEDMARAKDIIKCYTPNPDSPESIEWILVSVEEGG